MTWSCVAIIIIIIITGGENRKKLTAPKVLKQCPLVLLAKISWKQGKALGSAEGSVIESGL